MLVKELIEKLKQLNQDAEVVIEDNTDNEYQIDEVSEYTLIRSDVTEKIVTLTSNSIDTTAW